MAKLLNVTLDYNGNKGFRLLSIYERLNKGELLYKSQLAIHYGVTEKTIQRDFDDLRAYLADTHFSENEVSIKYDKIRKGYYLVKFEREWLTNEEVVATCKILLESRAMRKDELNCLINKLMSQVAPDDKLSVDAIIKNELYNYVPLKHNKKLLAPIWELSQLIIKKEIIKFSYISQLGIEKEHTVKPVAIMFSEYYFYLIAFMADSINEYPIVFRIDCMENIGSTKEKYIVPYSKKFNDGEFRKRVQFMYSGELHRVKFEYSGVLEAVLDRLPTAKVLSQKDNVYTIKAEAYGDGIYMWLRSQGNMAEIIS